MNEWKQLCVSAETPILEAIAIIERTSLQMVLVVGADKTLLGIVTDGDIRRGLLRGVSLRDGVRAVMNPNPVTAGEADHYEAVRAKMVELRSRLIPIVDGKKRVVGVHSLDSFLESETRPNWVVLMAGGQGSRMGELTSECPKPLLRVGGKPVLETILENFIRDGFRKFYVSVNYKAEMIEQYFGDGSRWGAEIRYLREDKRLGTAGCLSLLPETPEHPIFVMNGDVLTTVSPSRILEFCESHGSHMTVCVREYDLQVPYGIIRLSDHNVEAIDEKPTYKYFVNAGIYVLQPEVLRSIPFNDSIDMTKLMDKLIHDRMPISAFPLREYWIDIGRRSDFDRATEEYIREFADKR